MISEQIDLFEYINHELFDTQGKFFMYKPTMISFWVDFPLNAEQYSKLKIKWRRRQNSYEIQNSPPDLRIRNLCTFGGDDYQIISLEARGDVDEYARALKVMDEWIVETLGEY